MSLLLLLVPLSSACQIGDSDDCTPSEFKDRCDGNVAVTCEKPFATGSGSGGSAKITRKSCGSSTCGPTRECYQECDICDVKEISVIGCVSPNPQPLDCRK